MERCQWVDLNNPLYVHYHDKEWGVPVYNDQKLFEMIVLEGAQAGLSWSTVLKKREHYRKAFDQFDYKKIALYQQTKIDELLNNVGIIRNKLKINSAIKNAQTFLKIQKEFKSFSHYLWGFVNHKPIVNSFKILSNIPAKTNLSDKISKDLKKRGMSFIGSTIIYAFMQSIGMVNDHTTNCFRYQEIINSYQ